MIEQIIYKHKFHNFLENHNLDYLLETCEVESINDLTVAMIEPVIKASFQRSISLGALNSLSGILNDFSNLADWTEISKLVLNELKGVTQ